MAGEARGALHSKSGTNNVRVQDFEFSFAPNGTSDPAAASTYGRGIRSIAYVSTGRYKVTLMSKYARLTSFSVVVSQPTAGAVRNVFLDGGGTDVTAGVVYLLSVNAAGAPADLAAAADCRVSVRLGISQGPTY